jgi:hypothetical protein
VFSGQHLVKTGGRGLRGMIDVVPGSEVIVAERKQLNFPLAYNKPQFCRI